MQPDCLEAIVEPPPPPDPSLKDPEVPAEYFLLAVIVVIAIYEWVALIRGWNTISQRIQHWSKARRLFRWGGLALISIFAWHVLWGFPW